MTGVPGAGGFAAVVADIGNLFWNGVLGIGFVYVLLLIDERYRLLKGLLYGLIAWFSFYAVVGVFQVAVLLPAQPQWVAVTGLLAAMWGLTTAWLVGYFTVEGVEEEKRHDDDLEVETVRFGPFTLRLRKRQPRRSNCSSQNVSEKRFDSTA